MIVGTSKMLALAFIEFLLGPAGDKVVAYMVDKGVGGLNVRQTAFAFEHLLMEAGQEAAKKTGVKMKNEISSPAGASSKKFKR